jgi:outer membrane protein TolC
VGTNVEVTDAQVAVARAGQNVANARFDYLTAIARLRWATGSVFTTENTGSTE